MYQESYDNSGLLVGDKEAIVNQVLITLDTTEEVMEEAIQKGVDMIIMHHPIIFKGLKSITNDHWVSRCVRMAIKNDIHLYAIHTNLDSVKTGVNKKIAERLQLIDTRILQPKSGTLCKLITFVPIEDTDTLLTALFDAGAGKIGDYDHCSFRVMGKGSFRGGEESNPHLGSPNAEELVQENRLELVFPIHRKMQVIRALKQTHPYEEVAYDIYPVENENQDVGSGMIGSLAHEMEARDFFAHLKDTMNLQIIRHTRPFDKPVKNVAICGGSGSFLLKNAISQSADVLVTSDFKYHDFFEADGKIIIADIGHFESEVYTKDLLLEFLKEKFANIAVLLSEVNTNPIIYS